MGDDIMDVSRRPSNSLASQSFDREDSGTGKDINALPSGSGADGVPFQEYPQDLASAAHRSPDNMPIDIQYDIAGPSTTEAYADGVEGNSSNERAVRAQSVEMAYVPADGNDSLDPNDKRFIREGSSAMSDIILGSADEHQRDHTRVPILLVAESYPKELAAGLGEIMRYCVHKNFVTAESMILDEQRLRVSMRFTEDQQLPAGSLVVQSSHEEYSSVPPDEKFELLIIYHRRIEAFRALGRILGTAFALEDINDLGRVMRWKEDAQFDTLGTSEVLLAKCEETYELIGKLLDAASGPLRSKRIHIGMDEAHGVGEGRYKQMYGYKDTTDVFLEHLQRVHALCQERGLKPMLWSDNDYTRKIRHHRDLGYEPWVAGGIWTWNRLYAALPFTLEASRACLQACKRDNVRNVFVTTWGDDGNECDVLSALPGMLFYAEHGYTPELEVNWTQVSQNFAGIFGGRLIDWIDASKVDLVVVNELTRARFPDPLYAFLSPQYRDMDLEKHFSEVAENLFRASSENLETYPFNERLRFPALLARALSLKSNIRDRLARAHALEDQDDRIARLHELATGQLHELRRAIDDLWRYHRDRIWLDTYRPFGMEILELRYGAARTRLESLEDRVLKICEAGHEGVRGRIPELEAELGEVYVGASVEVVVDFARAYTPSRALGTG
ncbi:hypothetical protein HDV00_005587 [Rhizophlyctis rosea]|nr:hypothetical protein HDV00_005587 [Rhizophlyctis rosea]